MDLLLQRVRKYNILYFYEQFEWSRNDTCVAGEHHFVVVYDSVRKVPISQT